MMKDDILIEDTATAVNTPHRSRFSSVAGDTILVGDTVLTRHELDNLLSRAAAKQPPHRQFGNPTPLGLCSFALSCFVLSLINIGCRGVDIPKLIVALAFFYGGVSQFAAGMWELAVGSTFGGVAFGSFGPFWMAFGAIHCNAFGIMDAYKDDPEQLASVIGFFLFGWFIFTFIMVLCTLRTTIFTFALYSMLDVTFLLLACGNILGNTSVVHAGGYFGVVTSFIAWYIAFGCIRSDDNSNVPFYDRKMPF